MTIWVYIMTEPGVYTVGFYDPSGQFHSDSVHHHREYAAARVHYLNGGHGQ